MRIDASKSRYHEAESAKTEFDRKELRSLRILLRRLRFLEAQIMENGGLSANAGSGGAAFAEWEVDALEFALTELGFLASVSGNEVTGG